MTFAMFAAAFAFAMFAAAFAIAVATAAFVGIATGAFVLPA